MLRPSSAAVATSREGHRSPKSGREGQRRGWGSFTAQRRDHCQDTASRFVGRCEDDTDLIELCWASLRRPVGTYGDNVQWAASGGHPASQRQSASTRSFHNELWVRWNRNPFWVVAEATYCIRPSQDASVRFSDVDHDRRQAQKAE